MSVTFAVDDVTPAAERAPTVSLRELVGEHALLGAAPDMAVLDERTMHPLIGAVHHAFVDHRPLVLSPDAVWLTIAQGVAQHVRLGADRLRSRLVAHAGKQVQEVAVASRPASAADWASIITGFRRALGDAIGEGRARLLTCDFSTTTDAERIASEVVLMDVMSPYHDYAVSIVCGIPRITLLGTLEDWRQIRARIDVLAELELETWARSLVPISDRLLAAASGQPDIGFFQRIYKPRAAYGWDRVTGWIARLYPYVQNGRGDFSRPNPLLALPIDHEEPEAEGYFRGVGIRTCDPPPGASRVLVRCRAAEPDAPVEIVTIEGGLLAIEHDARGELVPRAGFVVRVNHGVEHVIERLRSEHGATSGHPSDGEPWHHDAQLRALFEAVGSASIQLRTAAWRLLPAADRARVLVARDESTWDLVATTVLDLGDGIVLAVTEEGRVVRLTRERLAPLAPEAPEAGDEGEPQETGPIVVRSSGCTHVTDERLEAIPVVAGSVIELLARALRGDEELRSSSSLLDVESRWWDREHHARPLVDRLRREHRIVEAPEGRGLSGISEVSVGASIWRKFVAPSGWKRGNHAGAIQLGSRRAEPAFDLGDGTVLAVIRTPEPRVVRLDLAAIAAVPVKKKIVHIVSSQPHESIPVLGRSLVEVLAYAVDHGRLPRPVESLAELASRPTA